jgi:hypothetical protein
MKILESSREVNIVEEYTVMIDDVKYFIWMKVDSDDNVNDFSIQDENGYVTNQFEIMEQFLEESGLDYWY